MHSPTHAHNFTSAGWIRSVLSIVNFALELSDNKLYCAQTIYVYTAYSNTYVAWNVRAFKIQNSSGVRLKTASSQKSMPLEKPTIALWKMELVSNCILHSTCTLEFVGCVRGVYQIHWCISDDAVGSASAGIRNVYLLLHYINCGPIQIVICIKWIPVEWHTHANAFHWKKKQFRDSLKTSSRVQVEWEVKE